MPLTSLEKLWAYGAIIIEHIQLNEICPISSLQTDFASLPSTVQQKMEQLSQMELDYIIERLAQAKQKGEIHSDNIETLGSLFLSSLKGAI